MVATAELEGAGTADAESLAGAIRALSADFSIEVTARDTESIKALERMLPTGTRVYMTHILTRPFSDTIDAAARVAAAGMRPVPHLAASSIESRPELGRIAAKLVGLGVEEILLIAGPAWDAVGEFDSSLSVLATGALEAAGIKSIGLAGHPEGNSEIAPAELDRAILTKNEYAEASPARVHLVTQFAFSADPYVAWERQIRTLGNRLPITVGLPGISSAAKLLKYAVACGVEPSIKTLRKKQGGLLNLASNLVPDRTISGIAAAASIDPASMFNSFHYFPFGGFVQTAKFASILRAGQFAVDPSSGRIELPA